MAQAVYLEIGKKKVFASAADWPGWCRAGRTEEEALAALADYYDRYAPVPAAAGVRFPKNAADVLEVVERLDGDATTDFGAPGAVAKGDFEPLTATQAERTGALVAACWDVLTTIAATTPAELRKGPRGGGRDRDKMLDHVLGAETAFARTIGVKHKQPALSDTAAIAAFRDEVVAVLSRPSDGAALTPKGWPPRYTARRIAWHALDHAWEMQDRTD
jgi:hypothetical protein